MISRSRGTRALTCAGRLWSVAAHLVERLGQAAAHERGLAGQQGVEDRAQAVDVGRRGERSLLAPGLLGRHVRRRSHGIARVRQVALGLDPPGQAEVGDVGLAPLVDQDVRRLQVAVQDAPLVGVMNGLGDGGHQPGRGREIGGEVAQPLVQAAARDQLHAEEALARRLAHLVDRHDVGMVELRDGLGLVLEPDQLGLAGEFGRPDDLEGDQPVQGDLPCLVDDAHSAPAQLRQDLVAVVVDPPGRRDEGSPSPGTVSVRGGPRRSIVDMSVVGPSIAGLRSPVRRRSARSVPSDRCSRRGSSVLPREPKTASMTSSWPGNRCAIGVVVGHIALLEPQVQLERQQSRKSWARAGPTKPARNDSRSGRSPPRQAASNRSQASSIRCRSATGQAVVERQPEMHSASSTQMARINWSLRSTVLRGDFERRGDLLRCQPLQLLEGDDAQGHVVQPARRACRAGRQTRRRRRAWAPG